MMSRVADAALGLSTAALSYQVYMLLSGPGSWRVQPGSDPLLVRRVRAVAQDRMQMSAGHAQVVRVFTSRTPTASSGGSLLFNNAWIALPVTARAAKLADLAVVCERMTFCGLPLNPEVAEVQAGLLYPAERLDFVIAHELAHLQCRHALITSLLPPGLVVAYGASKRIVGPGHLRQLGAVALCSATAWTLLMGYAQRCEFEADAEAVAPGRPDLAPAGVAHLEAKRAFHRYLRTRQPQAQFDADGESLHNYTHPTLQARIAALQS